MRRKILLALLAAVLLGGLVQAYPTSHGRSSGDPYAGIVNLVFYHVEKKYVEPERAQPRKLLEGALRGLETQYPSVLVEFGAENAKARVQVDEAETTFDLSAADLSIEAAATLNAVLAFVEQNLRGDVKKKELYYFALNGALSALDPHSNVFTPKHFKEFMIGTRGTFGGIGFVFGIRDGDMTIITPIEGTPADRGGLRSGDRILFIDGEPTINMAVDVAANKMRGEPGTQVTLTIEREGWVEPKAITFTREIIHVDSVESYVLNGDSEAPVLYAKVKNFQKDTTDELKKAARKAEAAHPDLKGVILDLRNNPGGLLEQAIALSDGFMDEGTIVATKGPERDANSRSSARRRDRQITDKDVIVLINQGSASASEIVSGALKSSRALVIGQKTFGKGSVQKLYPLTDGGALKLTVAQYLTPGDVSIQSIGIQPDIQVYPARIEPTKVRVGPPPNHVAEADLKNAFTDWGNSVAKPWAEIQYLEPIPGEDEKSFAELSREEKVGRLRDDFQVRLARRILARAGSSQVAPPRSRLKEAAEGVLAEARREEEGKIERELAALGVDWSGGESSQEARLEVALHDEVELRAGGTVRLTFAVRNMGTGAVHRLWGRTESANPVLNNLDFAFGKIVPGAEKTAAVEVEVPKSAVGRWDEVTLKLSSSGADDAGSGTGGARTVAGGKPEFVYTYEMKDENSADPARSSDGVLEEGERVSLLLRVQNRGEVPSQTAEVNIRGEEKEELYLETARHKFDGLAPGQERKAPMAFRLVKANEEGEISVGVAVSDREFSSFFGDNLTFRLGRPYDATGTRIPPSFDLAEPPPLRTSLDRLTVEVRAVDDEGLKEFYAYLGDKKIRYERNRAGGKELSVRLEVPLEEGSNRLVLAARDNEDLTANRTLFIYRTRAQGGQAELGMK